MIPECRCYSKKEGFHLSSYSHMLPFRKGRQKPETILQRTISILPSILKDYINLILGDSKLKRIPSSNILQTNIVFMMNIMTVAFG